MMKNFLGIAPLSIAAFCLLLSLCSATVSSAPEEGVRSATSISSSQKDRHDALHAVQEWGQKDRTGLPVTEQQSHSSDAQEADRKDRSRSQERTSRSSALLAHWGPFAKRLLPKATGVAPKFLVTAVLIATAIFLSSRLGRRSLEEADSARAGSEQASPSLPSPKLGLGLGVALLVLTLGLAAALPVRGPQRLPEKVKKLDPQMPQVKTEGGTIKIGEEWGDDTGEHPIQGSQTSIIFDFEGKRLVLCPSAQTAQQLGNERLTELVNHLTTHPPKTEGNKVEWGKAPPRGDSYVGKGQDEVPYDRWNKGQTQLEVYLPAELRTALQSRRSTTAQTHMYNLLHTTGGELVKLLQKNSKASK